MRDDAEPVEALMDRYAAGDRAAFHPLFERLAPGVHAFFVYAFRDRATADDLMQQTFLKLHVARKTYRPGSPVRPWLFAIASRVRLDEHRRRLRRSRVITEEDLETLEHAASGAPAAPPVAGDLVDAIRAAVERLPESQRVVVYLHRYEDLSLSEIAGALGISEGAVKQRASRAYAQIRTEVAPLLARREVA